jgi:malonate transporter
MILSAITVLLPVFFVLGLGYIAGRAKQFDADQVHGLNELVLDYAMPAMMFVATVKTSRGQLLSEGLFALALLVAFLGLFLSVVLVSTRVLHHSLGEAALQANLTSYPSVAFLRSPDFPRAVWRIESFSIALAAILSTVTIVPLTLVLLEIHRQRTAGGEAQELSFIILESLANTCKMPMV